MFGFNVDTHKFLAHNVKDRRFVLNRSVIKPLGLKILFSFRHDKAIYDKNPFSSRFFSNPYGQQPIFQNIMLQY